MEKKLGSRGVVILAVSSIILKLLSALYIPFLSGILTETGYAIYTVGYNVFVFLFAITSLGIQPAIAKLVAESKLISGEEEAFNVLKVAKKTLFIYGGSISLFLILAAYPFSVLFNSNESFLVFIFLSPAVLLAGILSTYRGYFQGISDMTTISFSNIYEQLLNVIISLLFAYLFMKISIGWGSAGGTVGTTVGAIGALVYIKSVINKKALSYSKRVSKESGKRIFKTLIKYSIPFILIAAIQNVIGIIDVISIRQLLTEFPDRATATFQYYLTLINVPLAIITAIGIAVYPKVIEAFLKNDKKDLKLKTAYCYKLIYIIAIPSVVGLALLSKEMFIVVFNRKFGSEILLYCSILLIFMSLSSIQNIILQGVNRFNFIIRFGIFTILIKIVFNILLLNIKSLNVIGVALSSVIAFGTAVFVNHIKLEKVFKVKIPILKQTIIPSISSVVMGVVIMFLKESLSQNLFNIDSRISETILIVILIVLGASVYGFSMIMLGGISKYELDTISPKLYNLLPTYFKKRISNA